MVMIGNGYTRADVRSAWNNESCIMRCIHTCIDMAAPYVVVTCILIIIHLYLVTHEETSIVHNILNALA